MSVEKKERIVYLDYLRVFALLSVILLHVSAQFWHDADVNSHVWRVFNIYDSISRLGVPVFVMISGALLIPRDIPIKKLYSKNILRMVTAYIVWNGFYCLIHTDGIRAAVKMFVFGYGHLWFIPMIIGIYMCLPFLKGIANNETLLKYFLVLGLIFAFLIPQSVTLCKDFGGEKLNILFEGLDKTVNNMYFHMVLGYPFYFLLGHLLNTAEIKKGTRMIFYALGIAGCLLTIYLDLAMAVKYQMPYSTYYGEFTVNVMLESVAVFVLFKSIPFPSDSIYKPIVKLSECSFGAYLVHMFVIEQLQVRFGITTLSFEPLYSVPAITIAVFVIASIISVILHYMPIVNKYLV